MSADERNNLIICSQEDIFKESQVSSTNLEINKTNDMTSVIPMLNNPTNNYLPTQIKSHENYNDFLFSQSQKHISQEIDSLIKKKQKRKKSKKRKYDEVEHEIEEIPKTKMNRKIKTEVNFEIIEPELVNQNNLSDDIVIKKKKKKKKRDTVEEIKCKTEFPKEKTKKKKKKHKNKLDTEHNNVHFDVELDENVSSENNQILEGNNLFIECMNVKIKQEQPDIESISNDSSLGFNSSKLEKMKEFLIEMENNKELKRLERNETNRKVIKKSRLSLKKNIDTCENITNIKIEVDDNSKISRESNRSKQNGKSKHKKKKSCKSSGSPDIFSSSSKSKSPSKMLLQSNDGQDNNSKVFNKQNIEMEVQKMKKNIKNPCTSPKKMSSNTCNNTTDTSNGNNVKSNKMEVMLDEMMVTLISKKESTDDGESEEEYQSVPNQTVDEIQNEIELLGELFIRINFVVPKLHQIATSLSRGPNQDQMDEINEEGLEIKTGSFSPEEDKIIKANWIQFCEAHDLPPRPELFVNLFKKDGNHRAVFGGNEPLKFVQYLANGLPNRLLRSVYQRFKTLFTNLRRGRFTEYEDKLIMEVVSTTKNASCVFARLGEEFNRDRLAVEKRYIWLKETEEHAYDTTKQVTHEQATLLIEKLLEYMNCDDVQYLKNKNIPGPVFAKIGKELKVRPIKIQQYWAYNLHPKLFVTGTRKMGDVKRNLIQLILRDPNIKEYRHVKYIDYIHEMDGWTTYALSKILKNIMSVAKNLADNFRDQLTAYANQSPLKEIGDLKNAEYFDRVLTIF